MVCSKCGFAVPKGQSSCVYCGTHVSCETAQSGSSVAKRSTGAFAKQIKSVPSEAQTDSKPAAGRPGNLDLPKQTENKAFTQKSTPDTSSQQTSTSPYASSMASFFTQQNASAPVARQPVVAPYARRPMYAAFDPNSEDSPFVRKPLSVQSDSESDAQTVQPVSQVSEVKELSGQQQAEKAPEVKQAAEASGEEPGKKKHGMSLAALTVVFVALVICFFINF